jgi:hypothetical protein
VGRLLHFGHHHPVVPAFVLKGNMTPLLLFNTLNYYYAKAQHKIIAETIKCIEE